MATYLHQLGIINALGENKASVTKNFLSNNQHDIVKIAPLFSGRSSYVGQVTSALPRLPTSLKRYDCRNNRLLLAAYQQIEDKLNLLKVRCGKDRIGVILGTSTSGIASGETAIKTLLGRGHFPANYDYVQQEMGACAEFLASYADVTGPHYTISTACSSSGKAIAAAARLIEADMIDVAIVGGSDSLCELTLNGFDSLELLSTESCNPFSKNRSGITIGEGAALFILSKEASPIKLSGFGESSDGYHMTTPDPTGHGAKLAMQQALSMANITANQIGYINLHGTGTLKNDEMESRAIMEIFGDRTICSSTKPLIGHTLGAAAAQELGLCWLLLSNEFNPANIVPKQLWDEEQDPELPRINLINSETKWQQPIFMSNSFAFGGSNVSLIIERVNR